jgi:hypothetical protein
MPHSADLDFVGETEESFSVPFIVAQIRRRISLLRVHKVPFEHLYVQVFDADTAAAVTDRLHPTTEQPLVRLRWL